MTWNVVIVDDEAPARLNLECALAEHTDWKLVGSCQSAADARALLEHCQADLILLDIRMPHESGLSFAESLCAQSDVPLIVFVTAYDEHALAAFDVYAIDYVLKPFDDARFARVLDRAAEQLRLRRNDSEKDDMLRFLHERRTVAAGHPEPALQYIIVRSVGRVERIMIDSVLWLSSAGNYVELHLPERTVLHRSTLNHIERRLPATEFIRVHRTAIVRRSVITAISVVGDGRCAVTLANGDRVAASERHMQKVRDEILA